MYTSKFGIALRAMAGVVALLLAGQSAAEAQQAQKLRVSLLPFTEVAPVHIGMKYGYFKEQSLEVETVSSVGGAAAIPGLVGGSFEIAYGNVVSSALAVEQGLPVKVISGVARSSKNGGGILVRAADNIKSGKDLEGKTIAVNTRNNVIWLYARAWVSATGGDPTKVSFKEVPFPQMADALKRRQVDAIYTVGSFYDQAGADKENADLGNPQYQLQPNIQTGQYIVTSDFTAKNPTALRAFLAAMKKANAWYDDNMGKQVFYDLIVSYTGASDAVVKSFTYTRSWQEVSLEELRKTYAIMQANGLLKQPLDPEKVVYKAP